MQINTLPEAIQREREVLLRRAVEYLSSRGYTEFQVRDLADFNDPPNLIIPVLNAPMQPDMVARQGEGLSLIAVVEVSTDLGDESCGRRWQAFIAWAVAQDSEFVVFVHQDEIERAKAIAGHWHVDLTRLIPLA